ncbi:MAG: hypothetical protein R2712_12230 [Vicinamibacterales bacterium]
MSTGRRRTLSAGHWSGSARLEQLQREHRRTAPRMPAVLQEHARRVTALEQRTT